MGRPLIRFVAVEKRTLAPLAPLAPEEIRGDDLVRPGGGLKQEAADAADALGETMIG